MVCSKFAPSLLRRSWHADGSIANRSLIHHVKTEVHTVDKDVLRKRPNAAQAIIAINKVEGSGTIASSTIRKKTPQVDADRRKQGEKLIRPFQKFPDSSPADSSARSWTRSGAFMLRRSTVALPVGVRPRIRCPDSAKWSFQRSVRGWYSGTSSSVPGSIDVRFGPLWPLHRRHARARFPGSSVPRCCRARMCSIWNRVQESASWEILQYSHMLPALSRTKLRTDSIILIQSFLWVVRWRTVRALACKMPMKSMARM